MFTTTQNVNKSSGFLQKKIVQYPLKFRISFKISEVTTEECLKTKITTLFGRFHGKNSYKKIKPNDFPLQGDKF